MDTDSQGGNVEVVVEDDGSELWEELLKRLEARRKG